MRRLEQIEHVLGAGGCPECEEMVVRVSQGSAAADGHEAWVAHLREDH
jgi:hypothetical protein